MTKRDIKVVQKKWLNLCGGDVVVGEGFLKCI